MRAWHADLFSSDISALTGHRRHRLPAWFITCLLLVLT